jgi:hypothetical protein
VLSLSEAPVSNHCFESFSNKAIVRDALEWANGTGGYSGWVQSTSREMGLAEDVAAPGFSAIV